MKSTQDPLGVAVVGLGIGEQHARAYLASGQCNLRWLCDLDGERARRLATELGTGTPTTSFGRVLDDPACQVVSLATFDDAHFGQVLQALDAGKHVFVEKPLCTTVDEVRQVKQAWSRHCGTLKFSSNLVLRTAPVFRWLKEKIEAGDFGRLYAFDGDYLYGRLHKITDGWRKDVKDYSVMLGGGIHLVDLLIWLTGERPRTVSAMGNRIATQESAFRYNDYAAMLLQCNSGLVGRISANFACVHRHQHTLRLFGTEATFLHDDSGPRLHVSRDPILGASAVTLATLPAGKGDLIPAFLSAIRNDADMGGHTQDIFDVICICAACDKSLASGSVEEVVYP
jgi:predicted dehydrogenase